MSIGDIKSFAELPAWLRSSGMPVMLTLAPEPVPVDTVRRIADMGVIVLAGHSAASAAEIGAGLAPGVKG